MAEEPREQDSVAMTVRANLRGLTAPLKEQLIEIERRLVEVERERDDLMIAKKEINKTIRWIEPSQAKANGNTNLSALNHDAKKKVIERYISTHKAQLANGFTAAELARTMKAAKITPVASPEMTRKILRELNEVGLVRSDRIIKGGGMRYLIVGRD